MTTEYLRNAVCTSFDEGQRSLHDLLRKYKELPIEQYVPQHDKAHVHIPAHARRCSLHGLTHFEAACTVVSSTRGTVDG